MKKIILTFLFIFSISFLLNAQERFVLAEKEFDFGKIEKGKPVTHKFVFQNNGKEPMVIISAQASCGCTTPEWPKKPILAGQKDEITVGYNAAGEGKFNKTIFVNVEGEKGMKEIVIKGEVIK